jgi:hypothetical protein
MLIDSIDLSLNSSAEVPCAATAAAGTYSRANYNKCKVSSGVLKTAIGKPKFIST